MSRRVLFAVTPAGGGFTGTPIAGSLVKTGQTPTLSRPWADSPIAGQIIKTGYQPNLSNIKAGNITKTGQTPVLSIGFPFTPIAGALVKTGQTPSLTRPWADSPVAGSMPKTGAIPTLVISSPSFSGTPLAGLLAKQGANPQIQLPAPFKGGGAYPGGERKRRRKREYLRLPDGKLVEVAADLTPEEFARRLKSRIDEQQLAADEEAIGAIFYMMMLDDED
jgi:hypothetical protein